MGGMSAQIPIKGDEKANEVAMAKVRADKLREVTAGHDGKRRIYGLSRALIDEYIFRYMDCSSFDQ
jgi:malate synthase